jgi:hypothetical protein
MTIILPSGRVLAVRQCRRGFLTVTIGSFWSRMAKPEFFCSSPGIAAVAGMMILGCRWVVKFQE